MDRGTGRPTQPEQGYEDAGRGVRATILNQGVRIALPWRPNASERQTSVIGIQSPRDFSDIATGVHRIVPKPKDKTSEGTNRNLTEMVS